MSPKNDPLADRKRRSASPDLLQVLHSVYIDQSAHLAVREIDEDDRWGFIVLVVAGHQPLE